MLQCSKPVRKIVSRVPEVIVLSASDPRYPAQVRAQLGTDAPEQLSSMGNLDLLGVRKLALVCSVRCPGDMILATYEFAKRMTHLGPAIVSGFHSPMERQCLALFLRRKVPVILCPARGFGKIRIPVEWRMPIAEGHLLLLSPFREGQRRATGEIALERNRLVTALADHVLISFASPGSKTEKLAREVSAWGKPLFTFRNEGNHLLCALGAQALQ